MKKKKKLLMFLIILIILILIFLITAIIGFFSNAETTYPVKIIDENTEPDINKTLYVSSIPYSEKNYDDYPHIYIFNEIGDKNTNTFYNPEFKDEILVVERYVNVFNSSYYTSSIIPAIYDSLFKIAGLSSEDNPLIIFEKDDMIFGLINETAYFLFDQRKFVSESDFESEHEAPTEISVAAFKNTGEQFTYKLSYNGQFEIISAEDDKEK